MKIPGSLFESDDLVRVETPQDLERLPESTLGLFVHGLSDVKLESIAQQLPHVRYLIADGSSSGVTDEGIKRVAHLGSVEALDLEFSSITDESLPLLAKMRALRWIDLGFCGGITSRGLAWLREARPDLEIWPSTG